MSINFNVFSKFNYPIQNYGVTKSPAPGFGVQNSAPVFDVFIKQTSKTQTRAKEKASALWQAQDISNTTSWTKDRFEKIYNEIYDEVMNSMPITKELNIQKPVLKFMEKDNDRLTMMRYNLDNNSISIFPMLKDDFFSYKMPENKIESGIVGIIASKRGYEKDLKTLPKMQDITILKLNDDEKELLIKGFFAHELRHVVQDHLMMSTKSTCNILKDINADINEATKEIERCREELEKLGGEKPPLNTHILEIKNSHYIEDYKPAKLIEDDVKLKFSSLDDDNRYWSTKNHLSLRKITDDHNEYIMQPVEIDANHYAAEYLVLHTSTENAREDIVRDIELDFLLNTNLEAMQEAGYPPLIEKH